MIRVHFGLDRLVLVWTTLRRSRRRAVVLAAVLALPLVHVRLASAQQGPAPAPAPAAPAPAPQAPPPAYGLYPAAPPPGVPLGGGNATGASSRPITGPNDRDGFDLLPSASGGMTVHGSENGSFILGEPQSRDIGSTDLHTVRRGDTLWAICDNYFKNPYQWPRIWSYNPQIQNPHWIYPGDQVRLRPGVEIKPQGPNAAPEGTSLIDRRKQVPPDTVFLRTNGYIEDDTSTNWGEIIGAPEDKMILADFDEVYLRLGSEHDVKLGQELTIYRPVRAVLNGKLIEIQGTARIDQWNPKERIARARIVETLDAIERGARVGPITRRFEVVPPTRNQNDVAATVVTSVQPHNFYGQNQVVFLDKGETEGLRPGNRLFIIRKGDAWHQSLTTRSSATRIALENPSPAAVETVPRPHDESKLPEEVLGELRVVAVRPHTSTCILTGSRREIETGDTAIARKGF